jgi:hypothetical protein
VFTSRRLFERVEVAHKTFGDLGVPLVTDGKYKMEISNWIVQPFGTLIR